MPSIFSDNWRSTAMTNEKDQLKHVTKPMTSACIDITKLGDGLDEDTRENVKFMNIYNRLKREQKKDMDGLKAEIDELKSEITLLKTSPSSSTTSTSASSFCSCGRPRRVRSLRMEEGTLGSGDSTKSTQGKGIIALSSMAQQEKEAAAQEDKVRNMIAGILPHLKGSSKDKGRAAELE